MANPTIQICTIGSIIRQGGSPELLFKEFSFGAPIQVEGWQWTRFNLTLLRHAPADRRATGEYIVDWMTASSGRHSTDNGAVYQMTLLNGDTVLRAIPAIVRHVPCSQDSAQYQTRIPDDTGWPDGFPLEFYQLIDRVRLEIKCGQDSC